MRSMRLACSTILSTCLMLWLIAGAPCFADSVAPLTVTDIRGNTLSLKAVPKRIVSLVPAATETLFALGAGDLVVGLTFHDTSPVQANSKTIVGGFADPSPELIERLSPDVILFSSFQSNVRDRFVHSGITLIQIDTRSMHDGFAMIELLGKLTGKAREAAITIGRIRMQLEVVSRKVAKIPAFKRKRVMRLMGTDSVITPADRSFQNEFIQAAGGIPPSLGKSGHIVPVSKEEWEKFNPQLIYYCGSEKQLLKHVAGMPGWKDVDAVKNSNYALFPCDLTCRASVHMGDFVAWLASVIYPDDLCDERTRLEPDKAGQSRDLIVDLPYVKSARVVDGTMSDFPFQTLCIDFTGPMGCTNSLAGNLAGISTVGNHYSSPPLWNRLHHVSLGELKSEMCRILGRDAAATSFLFTGAKMDGLSIQKTQFKDMIVYALVTAGVKGNAMRSGVDEGLFYEPGTINTIILTNMQLSERAQTRAIIAATEAKSAALQDLDIRSAYTPRHQATGTGTDEIIVVEGRGNPLENAGGHSKLGELIARAVHAAVKEAIAQGNGLVSERSVFQRLSERDINLAALVNACTRFTPEERVRMFRDVERLLLNPAYAGLLESAFALSNAYEAGQVHDLRSFEATCKSMSEEIAGCPTDALTLFVPEDQVSKPICLALNAFLNGLRHKTSDVPQIPPTVGECGR